jgi:hypothetical protein
VGDSTELGIEDYHCHIDLCSSYDNPFAKPHDWGRWSLSDSSVARLRSLTAAEAFRPGDYAHDGAMMLVAVRPGRLIVRATGVHTSADTMPSHTPLDTILEREIIVTPPVARLEISPRSASVPVGDSVAFSVRVLDRAGRTVEGAPVELVGESTFHQVWSPAGRSVVRFTVPGRRRIHATLGAYADSVNVDVRAASGRP